MKKSLIIIVALLALGLVGYGVFSLTQNQSNNQVDSPLSASPSSGTSASPSAGATNDSATSTSITSAELAKNNGKNGAKCWVAISGKVYDVSNERTWRNGEHIPSQGQAKCGRDETATIGQSPHGKQVLSQLPKIGQLAQE